MDKLTMKEFISHSSIDAGLIRAVVRQAGGWQEFKDMAQDITNHGINGGFHGFIYYSDTVAFAKRHKAKIIQLAKDMDREIENVGVIAFIASFGCLKGYSQEEIADGLYNPRSEDRGIIFNALAWFAGEEVARSLDSYIYDMEH